MELEKVVEKREIPPEREEEIEKEIVVPEKLDDRITKLRKLLVVAEGHVSDKNFEEAMENYTELREIYDSMSPPEKSLTKRNL